MSQILMCITNKLKCSSGRLSAFSIFINRSTLIQSTSFKSISHVRRSFGSQFPGKDHPFSITKRFYAKKRSQLSFESNANVAEDMMVFTYSNARFFRMLSVFGIMQFFFWGNMAMFAYSGMKDVDSNFVDNQRSWWINFQKQYKYRIAVGCIALGYVVLFFTWIYPLRTISKLVLEKGGQMVRFTTYTHFGRTKDFVVPLNDISCTQSRLSRGVQVSLKIRGRWFYYLMDKREGKFVNPELFDYVVGLNRSLK